MCAPRSEASSKSSRTTMPAPSASTNPSRFALKGLHARSGGSFFVESTRISFHASMTTGVIGASTPDEHAVVTVMFGPRVLNRIAMFEDDALYIDFGMAMAERRPLPFEKNAPQNSSIEP